MTRTRRRRPAGSIRQRRGGGLRRAGPSDHQVKHTSFVGTRYRDAASASVQIFLAGLDQFQISSLLMSGRIQHSALDQAGLDAIRSLCRRSGNAATRSTTARPPLTRWASPRPCDHRGQQVAALLVSAPRYRISPTRRPRPRPDRPLTRPRARWKPGSVVRHSTRAATEPRVRISPPGIRAAMRSTWPPGHVRRQARLPQRSPARERSLRSSASCTRFR